MDKFNNNCVNSQGKAFNTNFEEIFYQSPIGIILYNKEGKLINANDSALNIVRITKLDDILNTRIFDHPLIAPKKEDLLKNGLIKFQSSLDLRQIKGHNIHNSVEDVIVDIDCTASVTNSGYLIQIQDITEQKKVRRKI